MVVNVAHERPAYQIGFSRQTSGYRLTRTNRGRRLIPEASEPSAKEERPKMLVMRPRQLFAGIVSVGAILVFVVQGAQAGAPTEELRGHVDQVIKILQRPDLQGESKAVERRTAVRKVANDIFDFPETAKRSLGRHWQERTPAEREEFTRLFADLVEADQATVRTKILTKQGSQVP